ncbi:MAG: hypothetical protein ACOH1P_04510 [Lysobacter sp.]
MKRSIVSIDARKSQAAGSAKSAIGAVVGQSSAAQANSPQSHLQPRRRSSQQASYTSGSAYLSRSRRGGFGSRSSMFRIS